MYSIRCAQTRLTLCSFAEKVIKAYKGEKGIVEPSFVYLPGVEGGDAISKATGTEFFSVPIELGVSGTTI
jgi:malate dehydrogenase